MNICGCLVHIAGNRLQDAQKDILEFDGVEIHAANPDGRLVIVVEDTDDRLASETIMDLHQVPGVISLTLTYHHFGDVTKPVAASAAKTHPKAGDLNHDHL